MERKSNIKKRWWILAAIGIFVAGALYFLFDPASCPIFPRCPFLLVTGFLCPGCGSQRAAHALMHGDILSALAANALLVISIPYILLGGYWAIFPPTTKKGELWRGRLFGHRAIWIVLGIVLAWWVGRNIFEIFAA